ncbi:MAG TPA: NAD(P)H-binding protein [Dongiaceae bacterium]|nr:NAD(P)H-binding protein [Dongiaceae bacterium]
MSRILVIGGTGTVGRHVVSQLAARGEQVRAMVREPARAEMPPQVEVVRGDLTAPETLEHSLDGVRTIFLVWTAPPAAVPSALENITRHAQRIVFLSAPLKTPHPLFQQPNPLKALMEQIERAIQNSGADWTFLRPGMFAANALGWWALQIRRGEPVRWPYLDVPTAPIDERDIATIATRALSEDGHGAAEYVLTGPQSLTQFEQLGIIGRVLRRPLKIEEISEDQARAELTSIFPLPALNMLLNAWSAARGYPAHISSTFQEITGRPPRTFEDWAKDHVAQFQS